MHLLMPQWASLLFSWEKKILALSFLLLSSDQRNNLELTMKSHVEGCGKQQLMEYWWLWCELHAGYVP